MHFRLIVTPSRAPVTVFDVLVMAIPLSLRLASAAAWPAVYLAPVLGLLVAAGLLWQAQRPRRRRSVAA